MNDKTLWRVKYHGILKKEKKTNTQRNRIAQEEKK